MQRQIRNWRKELPKRAETGTGSDNGKLDRKKRKIFQKYRVTNVREVAQLTETLKQKVQAKAQKIRRYEKRETQYIQNRCSKKTPKIFTENWAQRIQRSENPPSMTEEEPYWKSMWGEKAQHNERAEWIRREDRKKISNMDRGPTQFMEITSFLSKAHNWKSHGNDQIQNYWLKAFAAAHRHITKNFQGNNGGTREGT